MNAYKIKLINSQIFTRYQMPINLIKIKAQMLPSNCSYYLFCQSLLQLSQVGYLERGAKLKKWQIVRY